MNRWVRRVQRRLGRRCRGERGGSLVFMLAFLSALGVLGAAMLTVSYASFKNTQTTRHSSNRLYGADGGVDYGIQLLRDSASYCPDTTAGVQALPTQTINGKTVTVTCQTLTSGSNTIYTSTHALILTGYNDVQENKAPDFSKLFWREHDPSSPTDVMQISGNVFNAGFFKIDDANGIVQVNGNLDQYNGTTPWCTNNKALNKPTVTGTWTCRTSGTFPVPDPAPALAVPTTAAPASVLYNGTCRIFFPGRYTTKPATFDEKDHYYFASGVYYFDDVGELLLEAASMFGGQPGPGETQKLTGVTPCANDTIANSLVPGSATGSGVMFVMGGDSNWKVHGHDETKVELYARRPGQPWEVTTGVSVYAPRVAGSNWLANDRKVNFDMDNIGPDLVIHGLYYAPGNDADKVVALNNSGAGNAAIFEGGAVFRMMHFKYENDNQLGVKLAGIQAMTVPTTERTSVITATSTAAGEAPVTETAVVYFSGTAGVPPTVQSWRRT